MIQTDNGMKVTADIIHYYSVLSVRICSNILQQIMTWQTKIFKRIENWNAFRIRWLQHKKSIKRNILQENHATFHLQLSLKIHLTLGTCCAFYGWKGILWLIDFVVTVYTAYQAVQQVRISRNPKNSWKKTCPTQSNCFEKILINEKSTHYGRCSVVVPARRSA